MLYTVVVGWWRVGDNNSQTPGLIRLGSHSLHPPHASTQANMRVDRMEKKAEHFERGVKAAHVSTLYTAGNNGRDTGRLIDLYKYIVRV